VPAEDCAFGNQQTRGTGAQVWGCEGDDAGSMAPSLRPPVCPYLWWIGSARLAPGFGVCKRLLFLPGAYLRDRTAGRWCEMLATLLTGRIASDPPACVPVAA